MPPKSLSFPKHSYNIQLRTPTGDYPANFLAEAGRANIRAPVKLHMHKFMLTLRAAEPETLNGSLRLTGKVPEVILPVDPHMLPMWVVLAPGRLEGRNIGHCLMPVSHMAISDIFNQEYVADARRNPLLALRSLLHVMHMVLFEYENVMMPGQTATITNPEQLGWQDWYPDYVNEVLAILHQKMTFRR